MKTTYSSYDRFGRVGKIKPPGTNEPTKFTYKGERLKTRESRIRLEAGMASPGPLGGLRGDIGGTTEYYNNRGKLVLLCENQATDWSGACDSGELQTNYTYDVGDRVKLVCLNPLQSTPSKYHPNRRLRAVSELSGYSLHTLISSPRKRFPVSFQRSAVKLGDFR